MGLLDEPQGENFLTWSDISLDFLSKNQHTFSLCVLVNEKIDGPSDDIFDEIPITLDGQQITPDRNLRSRLGLSEGIRDDDDQTPPQNKKAANQSTHDATSLGILRGVPLSPFVSTRP